MAVETKNKIRLGAGRVFFAAFNAAGETEGELYLGESPGITLGMTGQRNDVFSADVAAEDLIAAIESQVEVSGTLVVQHIDQDTMRYFFAGEEANIAQSATPVTDEDLDDAKIGRWYQLGITAANPTGVLGVGAVAVSPAAGGANHAAATYELDAANGRIRIIGGTISAGDDLHVDYTPVAKTIQAFKSRASVFTKGLLRFVEDNVRGGNRTYVLPNAELSSGGEASLKSRTDPTELSFAIRGRAVGTKAAIYVAEV